MKNATRARCLKNLRSVALLVLFAAPAGAGIVSPDFTGHRRNDSVFVLDFRDEVNISPRWAAKREGCVAVVVRYREIAYPQDIHANEGIDASKKDHFRDRHHRKHGFIWKADIDQVAGCGKRSTANSDISCADGRKL